MGREVELRVEGEASVTFVTKSVLSLLGAFSTNPPIFSTGVSVPLAVVGEFTVTRTPNPDQLLRWKGKVRVANVGDGKTRGLKVEARLQGLAGCDWRTLECLSFDSCCGELKPRQSFEVPFSYDYPIDKCRYHEYRVFYLVSVDDGDKNDDCKKKEEPKREVTSLCVQVPFNPLCTPVEDPYQVCARDNEQIIELSTDTYQVTKTVTYNAAGVYTNELSAEIVLPNSEFLSASLPFVVEVS